ncbi:MAG: hypothetical protein JJ863_21495 [Deltaproteobacteria bacterium]|nr:hypothetical protein [Deltaproteobacteria bacterium]
MRHLVLLLLFGCAESIVVTPPGCEPIGEGVLSFTELEGDCGALPDLEGVLDAGRIDTDPRGYRCAYRPERDEACGLAFDLTCEAMPPIGELELVGALELEEPGRWVGEAERVMYPLEGRSDGCRSTYAVEAVGR